MAERRHVEVADPNIDQVLAAFLEVQRGRLKASTARQYERVVQPLRGYLNAYGYEGLDKEESALFEKHDNAQGEGHRGFCALFGPERIVVNFGMFLGYYMVRKVMCGADLLRRRNRDQKAGPVAGGPRVHPRSGRARGG